MDRDKSLVDRNIPLRAKVLRLYLQPLAGLGGGPMPVWRWGKFINVVLPI